ncbi:hypothetical protein [Streptomyces sp. CBMA156]|uniref:hypothetical protein n=1 Tax=Streptomyces sp. CBMA156 TaxID=1930280 RepID=UPI001661A3C6|nr:hypothetical protein [Streptomyces sp. CBMA156]MBD0673328.1 hypothetical protein [Streptomyces sp. CBMA156]MBD0674643.1 hypothetical protein [Streptomyces sp. CBMA156]
MAPSRVLLAAALLACGSAAVLAGCTPADSAPTVAAASAAALADEGADDLLDEDDGLFYEEEEEAGPYSPGAGPSAVTPAASGPSADPSADPSPDPSADQPAEPSAGPSALPFSGPECATPTGLPGHEVLVVVSAAPDGLTARPARFGCGPVGYEPTGAPTRYGFATAGVAATLIDEPYGDPVRPVPLHELIAHLDDCLAGREPAASPDGCHGNAYDVVLDSHGRIMRIGEVAAS